MKKLILIVFLLVVLPNCAKYKPSSLPHPTGLSQESEDIKVITRRFTDKECETCFDSKDAAKKYVAVQVYVKNNRSNPIILSANNIDLPLESSKNISKAVHRNTAGRVAAYSVASLFFWPLIIPAAVDGAKSSTANYKADRDLEAKIIGQNETEIIKPDNSINKVFFVPRDQMREDFNLTLVEQDSLRKVNFICTL